MASCEYCGKELKDGAKFCEHCGSSVSPKSGEAEPVAPTPEQSASPEAAQPAYNGAAVNGQTQGGYTPPANQPPPQQGSYTPPGQAQSQGSYVPPSQAQGGYAPPPQAQGGYAPPPQAQGGYAPPPQAQGGYAPPSQAQGGYSPASQAQGGYSPPQGGYSGGVAVKEKKPIDKRIFIFGGAGLALILVIVLLVSLLGGKNKNSAAEDDPNLGLWVAVSAEMWGVKLPASDMFEDGFTIELKDKGKCTLVVDGESANGKWTLENGAFTVKGGGVDYSGSLENGVLTLLDVEGSGLNLIFYKDGINPGGSSNGGSSNDGDGEALYSDFVSPTTSLEIETYWYGSLVLTNVYYDGQASDDEWRDIWGFISEDDYLTYLELFETPDYSDSPFLSMYVDVFEDRLDAEIGENNAWIFDLYLELEDEPYFRPYLENGALRMDYPYDDGYLSCDITIFIREDGAPWDEVWDPLPPGYYDYAAGLGLSDSGADIDLLLPAAELKAAYDAMDPSGMTYEEVRDFYLYGIDGELYRDEDALRTYKWQAEESESQTLYISFKKNEADKFIYTSRSINNIS